MVLRVCCHGRSSGRTDDDSHNNITVTFCFYDNTPIYVTAVFDASEESAATVDNVGVVSAVACPDGVVLQGYR